MKKDIKDYLHLYLGCDAITKWHLECTLVAVTKSEYNPYSDCKIMRKDASKVMLDASFSDITLILRPLSSMTEADGLKIFGSKTKYLLYRKEAKELGADLWLFTANEYTELLKAGFDCHDLIPNNLAINAETLK